MTAYLVVLGLFVLTAGLIFRNRVKPVLRWCSSALLLCFTVPVLLFEGVMVLVFTSVMFLALIARPLIYVASILLMLCVVVTYPVFWLVAMFIWAVSRKRTALDELHRLTKRFFYLLDVHGRRILHSKLGMSLEMVDNAYGSFGRAFNFASMHTKIFGEPFMWLSRKIWPRN